MARNYSCPAGGRQARRCVGACDDATPAWRGLAFGRRSRLTLASIVAANGRQQGNHARSHGSWRRATTADARANLLALYEAAVAAAHPDVCLPPTCPTPPEGGRLYVVGAGKAAAAMAIAAEAHYRKLGALDRVAGFTTAPHGTLEALERRAPERHRDRLGAAPDAR